MTTCLELHTQACSCAHSLRTSDLVETTHIMLHLHWMPSSAAHMIFVPSLWCSRCRGKLRRNNRTNIHCYYCDTYFSSWLKSHKEFSLPNFRYFSSRPNSFRQCHGVLLPRSYQPPHLLQSAWITSGLYDKRNIILTYHGYSFAGFGSQKKGRRHVHRAGVSRKDCKVRVCGRQHQQESQQIDCSCEQCA